MTPHNTTRPSISKTPDKRRRHLLGNLCRTGIALALLEALIVVLGGVALAYEILAGIAAGVTAAVVVAHYDGATGEQGDSRNLLVFVIAGVVVFFLVRGSW
jgi:hypothetical protein